MKNILIVIAILISASTIAQNGDKNFIDQNYIEVVGKAELVLIPDIILINIKINEADYKNKMSISEFQKKMLDKLSAIGIDTSNDVRIKYISSHFKRYYLTKYKIQLSKEYIVSVSDAKTANSVFTEMEKIGISEMDIEDYNHSKITEYRKQVKINAIKAAKEKAQFLTTAINQEIGRAIYIQEDKNNSRNSNYNYRDLRAVNSSLPVGSSNSEDVIFKKIRLTYSVLCRFELN